MTPRLDPYTVEETTLTMAQLRRVRDAAKRVHVVQLRRDESRAA